MNNDALVTAAHGLHASLQSIELTAHNLANAGTPGFRRRVSISRPFDAILDTYGEGRPRRVAVADIRSDLSPGNVVQTGRPLDIVIQGPGYFEIGHQSVVGYTRKGEFMVAADGQIVDNKGRVLLGANGPIYLTGGSFDVMPDGEIRQGGAAVGRIRIVDAPADAFIEEEDGLLHARGEVKEMPVAKVLAGHLEGSNVSTQREMAGMAEKLRVFEALQRLAQAYDEQMSSTIAKLSEG